MPTDVWEAQISFDGFTYTPTPDPGGLALRNGEWWVGLEAVCLPLLDPLPQFNPATDDGNFCLMTGYTDYANAAAGGGLASGAFQLVTMRFGDSEVMPPQWAEPFIISAIFGA